ncbi:hypothetical protein FD688_01310 [Apilactobacillus kunkeei]|uniref:hypothetical protein n=1 Tax=Apilactobacillus kunkeei TaxID=148814 RepID=UPI00110C90A7|nr:hypothetical protein [Apilactobacillus kunkeei]TMT01479.1 hypothetical protein FD688_01310 [Apilactobacillus kunkeei]
MRVKNTIKLLLMAVLAFITISFSTNAEASTKVHYISSYPKFIRGSWYMRTKWDGQWGGRYLKYTKNRNSGYSLYSTTRQATNVLHNIRDKKVKASLLGWKIPVYAGYVKKNNRTWYFDKYWGEKKSVTPTLYYTYSKYKGHHVVVLADSKFRVTNIAYRNDKLAKKYYNKKIKHFKYNKYFAQY